MEDRPGANIDTPGTWAWLGDETWKFYTNVAPYYDSTHRTQAEVINSHIALWGADNIRVDEVAYDADQQVLPGYKAVFVRRDAQHR